MTDLKIGDTLWTHRRGQPKKWDEPRVIVGQTKLSWLVGSRRNPDKVNKATLKEAIRNMTPRQWYTDQGKWDLAYIRANRHRIASAIYGEKDVRKLREVAAIIGVPEHPAS